MPKRKIDWYGPKLRELRKEAGLSQAELGEQVDLAGSQINKLETNVSQPTLATALAIADALSVPIERFRDDASPAETPPPPPKRGRPAKAADAAPTDASPPKRGRPRASEEGAKPKRKPKAKE